jgi:Mn-containing catalase
LSLDSRRFGRLAESCRIQPAVFAPDYAPEEIAEIAQKLRTKADLPAKPTGQV